MVRHELNTLVFTISPVRADLLHREVLKRLVDVGDIPMNTLVFIAINQLTIGKLISPRDVLAAEQLCSQLLPNYNYEQHQAILGACEMIAGILYQDYQQALTGAQFALPAKLIKVDYSFGTVAMVFECLDDRSCEWTYTTLGQ
jgi:hypothetical protein